MGSVRSSSTTYSSGGFLSRNRHNSVYSSPESGQIGTNGMMISQNHQQQQNNPNFKMSFYDRFRRKSIQSQRAARQAGQQKLNSIPISLKNRPRIPTPDVTKEVIDREQRLALSASNAVNIGAGVVGVMAHQTPIPTTPPYQQHDVPILQVVVGSAPPTTAGIVLSPIQGK